MIRHFLKDGREVRSIAGHVVKMSEARGAYAALEGMKHEDTRKDPGTDKRRRPDVLRIGA